MEFLVCSLLYKVRAGLELVCHGLDALHQRFHLVRAFNLLIVAQGGQI